MSIASRLLSMIRSDSSGSTVWGGWYNNTTGAGTSMDKSTAWRFQRPPDWTVQELSDLYLGDSIARRAVSAIVEDSFRQGFAFGTEGDPGAAEDWIKRANEHCNMTQLARRILRESRLYGGVAVVPLFSNSGDTAEPLSLMAAGRLNSIQIAEPDMARPYDYDRDFESPRFNMPILWDIRFRGHGMTGGKRNNFVGQFDASRVLPILGGIYTGLSRHEHQRGRLYPYWPQSMLGPVLEGLRLYRSAMASIGVLFQDASQGVYTIHGLNDILSGGADTAAESADRLNTWMTIQDQMKSAVRAITLDAGDKDRPPETYQRISTPMAEMANLIDRFQALVSEVTGSPISRLFGQAPSGLSTDDLSGTRNWYDQCQAFREDHAGPLLRKMVAICAKHPDVGPPPGDYTIEWPSLWQLNPEDEAAARLTTAQADAVYLQTQVYQPEDVTLTRTQPDGWRLPIQIDESTLEERLVHAENLQSSATAPEPQPPAAPTPRPVEPPPES